MTVVFVIIDVPLCTIFYLAIKLLLDHFFYSCIFFFILGIMANKLKETKTSVYKRVTLSIKIIVSWFLIVIQLLAGFPLMIVYKPKAVDQYHFIGHKFFLYGWVVFFTYFIGQALWFQNSLNVILI